MLALKKFRDDYLVAILINRDYYDFTVSFREKNTATERGIDNGKFSIL